MHIDTSPWTLIEGDCLDVLRRLPDASVDAVVTDPPYGIEYRGRSARHRPIANDDRPFIWWLRDAWRVTKDGGALICFCRWDVQEAFRFAIELAGFTVKSQVVWDRERHGMGDLAASFAPRHDVAWFATKGRFRFPGGRPVSVVRAARAHASALQHPTEKPVPLMQQLVRAVCPVGGLVLDPFAGSGSTGVAALLEGRRFLGVELDVAYSAIARQRLADATPVEAATRATG